MRSSTMLQVFPYLLLEYIYGDNTTEYAISSVKPSRLINGHTGEKLFLNGNNAKTTTGNIIDYSAANLSGANWVSLDRDVPAPYITLDSNLVFADMSSQFISGTTIKYDTLRFHIQSGYNFDTVEGLLFQAYVREALTSKMANLTSNVVFKSTDRLIYNSVPFFVTDRVYDRYIDIYVPSLSDANQKYYANPANKQSLAAIYSSDGNGFLINGNIYVKTSEVINISKRNGITYFQANESKTVTVRQNDVYQSVSAVVKEASDGDYFEYYPTNNGAFIEDLIVELNSQGGNYAVINQIDIIEQVGLEFVQTSSFMNMQTTGYDGPLTFRPILKYADVSPSFSVEYTARIYNTIDSTQILKKATVTSYNPKRYGKNIEKIALSNVTSPLKVYNKVYSGHTVQYNAPTEVTPFNTVYIPVFYDSKNLFVGSKNVLTTGANPVSPSFSADDIYFGQGAARIYLGNFEQYFKFSVYQYVQKTNSMQAVDLSAMQMLIGFEDSAGKLFTYPALPSTAENSTYEGEIVFKIQSDTKNRMGITSSSVKSFYIMSSNSNNEIIKMYTGTVQTDDNLANESTRISNLGSQAVTLKELAANVTSSSSTASTTQTLSGNSAATNTIVSQLNSMNVASVNPLGNQQTLNPVIPGLSTDTGAQNMTSISPVSK